MALGKPVVCYIRPDLVDKYPPGLPIRSAHPDNLRDVLRELVSDHELRRSLGIQGSNMWNKIMPQTLYSAAAEHLSRSYGRGV